MGGRPVTLGIDLGGTKCLGLALGSQGEVLAQLRVPTPHDPTAAIDAIVSVAAALRDDIPGVAAVGVGAPGLVDVEGVLRFAPNLRGMTDGVPLRESLAERLGLPVVCDNDATLAAWGEHEAGAGRGTRHLVLITLGTGIGGGFVRDGRLDRGAHGFAGEVGHMVVDPYGPPCSCGSRGCWERFASGSGLGRLAREAAEVGKADRVMELAGGDPDEVRGEHVTAAAAEGDEDALEVMAGFAWWLALGLSNLANIFDPDAIVIGGGLIEAGDLLLTPTRRAFATMLEAAEHRPSVPILPARLGERAGAMGAAYLARESSVGRSGDVFG